MPKQHSVAHRVASYLMVIIFLAGLISVLSLTILISTQSDAKLINLSGSLRMQSYRLLHLAKEQPKELKEGITTYQATLLHSSLTELNSPFKPHELRQNYLNIIHQWQKMESYLKYGQLQVYSAQIVTYVEQVDQFVSALQHYAEHKTHYAVIITLICMILIIAIVSYLMFYTRRQIVTPLQNLLVASSQLQQRRFEHVTLESDYNNELGQLSKVFTQMSSELAKLYNALEQKVDQKTQRLSQVNRSLAMLFHSSQLLSATEVDGERLEMVMHNLMLSERLKAIELIIFGAEHWNVHLGSPLAELQWQEQFITIQNKKLGVLRWQAGFPCPDYHAIQNITQMLGRAIYFNQTQRQQKQLLLMEERSIIARELHDSLAQVLAFLQIQLKLLKFTQAEAPKPIKEKSMAIIAEFEQALHDGYVQLRELLATFRLTVQEANLKLALEAVINSLKTRTDAKIELTCLLPSQLFNAQQQVHVLQIVREALLNAIKHANAKIIRIIAQVNEEGDYEIKVQDDGVGIKTLQEPEGHYGLNIIQERAKQLHAQISIESPNEKGTTIKLLFNNKSLENK